MSILSYEIECYTKSTKTSASSSFFGTQEVMLLETDSLGITGGSFALSFGTPTFELPGEVDIIHGSDFITSSHDLAPFVGRGDTFLINGYSFSVHDSNEFTSSRVPLSSTPCW